MSGGNRHFDKLVEAGNPVGEVIAVEKFLIKVRGLQPCAVHALIMFEDGSKGFVHQVQTDHVVLLAPWYRSIAYRHGGGAAAPRIGF